MKTAFVLAFLVLLTGCGGRDFIRPQPEALKLGSTTYDQVVQTFGAPAKASTATINGAPTRTAVYAHAAVGTLGTTFSVRQMVCIFNEGVLVSFDYASSFDDKLALDDTKIKSLKAGDSKAAVVAALGEPTGQAIFPVVSTKGNSLVRYTFLETDKTPFVPKPKETRKVATISFDGSDSVMDVRIVETKSD